MSRLKILAVFRRKISSNSTLFLIFEHSVGGMNVTKFSEVLSRY